MKDIGSIFPLYPKDLVFQQRDVEQNEKIIYFSLCREALLAVAQSLESSNKIVLLPAYTCDTVYQPFKQLGWNCVYYSINKDLTIDTSTLLKMFQLANPCLVIAHPFFGMELNQMEIETLRQVKMSKTKVMIDITQCIFSQERLGFVDYYTGSYRKWFPIPDGGFLQTSLVNEICPVEEENKIFVSAQQGAMYLRGEYFSSDNEDIKKMSIQLNKTADAFADGEIIPHKMSYFSIAHLSQQDMCRNQKIRKENYTYMYKHLKHNSIEFVCNDINRVSTAPLYFPLYTENRAELQRYLAAEHIYLPVIWPIGNKEVLINDGVKFIYDHILCIPIDQRYSIDDMNKIVELINHF